MPVLSPAQEKAMRLARLATNGGTTENERANAAKALALLLVQHGDTIWTVVLKAPKKKKRIDAEDVAQWFARRVADSIRESDSPLDEALEDDDDGGGNGQTSWLDDQD